MESFCQPMEVWERAYFRSQLTDTRKQEKQPRLNRFYLRPFCELHWMPSHYIYKSLTQVITSFRKICVI